jgi:hypothetical protein
LNNHGTQSPNKSVRWGGWIWNDYLPALVIVSSELFQRQFMRRVTAGALQG